MMAMAGWIILNVLLAWGAAASLTEAAGIAWEAHLGGFSAGLLMYGFFDRPPCTAPMMMLRPRNRSLAQHRLKSNTFVV